MEKISLTGVATKYTIPQLGLLSEHLPLYQHPCALILLGETGIARVSWEDFPCIQKDTQFHLSLSTYGQDMNYPHNTFPEYA